MTSIFVGIFPWGNPEARLSYPLVKSKCDITVQDVYTVAEVIQDYVSSSDSEQEVNYVFPLPPTAAVCAFKAVINDTKTIEGMVKEKGEAKRMYKEAISQGKRAGLLEKEHVDVFRISLGNIKPSDKISVHLSYISLISHDGDSSESLRLTIPTTIAPRYGSPPTSIPGSNPANTFELSVSIQMNAPITAISSPTHPISVNLGRHTANSDDFTPNNGIVALHNSVFLETDVVVVISAQKLDHPRCVIERWPVSDGAEETTDAYALTFVPKVDMSPIQSQEYIFLVDRSGSMSGQRIESVKNALQIMLRSLPSRKTTFNVISFGSWHNSLWKGSQVYNKDTVDTASQHVDTLSANYGGTELASALKNAYASKTPSSQNQQASTAVFILTDGEAWDLRGVVDVVSSATNEALESGHLLRTFVLGVGDNVSVGMCEAIARAGKGVAIFVASQEKPDAKLVNLLRAARGGVIDNVSIDWAAPEENEEFEVVPKSEGAGQPTDSKQDVINLFDPRAKETKIPELGPQDSQIDLPPPSRIQQSPASDKLCFPIYPGFRCSIYAIIKQYNDQRQFPSAVKIRGQVNGKPVSLNIEVMRAETPLVSTGGGKKSHWIHTLAARALVQDLEDQGNSPHISAQIARLGLRYSLATSATSFIAIEKGTAEVMAVEEEQKYSLIEEDYCEDDADDDDDDMGFGVFDDADPIPSTSKFLKSASREDDSSDEDILLVASASPLRQESVGEKSISSLASAASSVDVIASVASRVSLSSSPVPDVITTQTTSPPPTLSLATIAKAQNFDGIFYNTPETVRLLLQGNDLPPLPGHVGDLDLASQEKDAIWVTCIALAVLEKNFTNPEERTAWSLLASKAMDAVNDILIDAGLGGENTKELVERLKKEAGAIL